MSNPNENVPPDDNQTLSPEAQAMLGKARRSFGISIGILLLGFMAIGVALVYRVMRDAPPPAIVENVSVPSNAQVISALLSDGVINVTYSIDGITTLALFDQSTGELTRQVVLGVQ